MSIPLPTCRHHLMGECPKSQLVVIDERKTHYSFGCLTCRGITIITRGEFDSFCLDESNRRNFNMANKEQKSMFSMRR